MMTHIKTMSLFLTLFSIAFTPFAQCKLEGHSDIGDYSIDVNPNRGITGGSYIKFENVVNEVRISTTKNDERSVITIKVEQAPVLVFEELANKQLVLLEASVTEKWPYLIDQTKAKAYLGKPFSYSGDSYKKAAELFVELLTPVSKREVGFVEKIIWYNNAVFYGQYIHQNASGEGKLYDSETNELYLSCERFVTVLCQGMGKQYDVSIPTIIYEGEFVDSRREGKGKEWFLDESYLEGNYISGNREGPFVQTLDETKESYGFIAKGNYKNNQKVGLWHYKFGNGREIQFVYEAGKLVSKTVIKELTPTATTGNNNESGYSAQEQVVISFLKVLFVEEDKAEAENFISPSFLQKVKKINSGAILNAYSSSQYELVRQNGNRILVNLYLLKGSKQLYNELTFSVEEENGQNYIKPNIRDYDHGQYYNPWVDFERVEN